MKNKLWQMGFWNILEIYIDLWEEMPNTFGETVGKVGEASLEVDK